MANTILYFRLAPLLLMLPLVVNAVDHDALHDEQLLEEAEFIEKLMSEKTDILAEETPLISPADDNATNSGVIDRHSVSSPTTQSDNVTRSVFALAVIDREPVDEVSVVSTDSVYYFTELSGLEGTMVRHRWIYQGEVMADVEFQIGGSRWRVWSKKSLLPRWAGQWSVSVVDEDGVVMQSETVEYRP